MKLVVDTNRIIAALVKDGASRHLITHFDGELITIGFAMEELVEHKKEILEKARISDEEFEAILSTLFSKMTALDDRIIAHHLPEADQIIGRTDPDDAPFIAAAIATGSAIWSDDRHFGKQARIRVITTKELLALLG